MLLLLLLLAMVVVGVVVVVTAVFPLVSQHQRRCCWWLSLLPVRDLAAAPCSYCRGSAGSESSAGDDQHNPKEPKCNSDFQAGQRLLSWTRLVGVLV